MREGCGAGRGGEDGLRKSPGGVSEGVKGEGPEQRHPTLHRISSYAAYAFSCLQLLGLTAH
jgi:hypothetical protein